MLTFKYASFIFLIFLFSVLVSQKTGFLHPEAQYRIQNYLDSRNLFQKVYDIDKNEYGLYQARELSHFFDYLDANFIKLSTALGFPHFYSLVYFISIFWISAICLHIAKMNFNYKNFLIPCLIIFIYLTSPIPFFSSYMFRSSKILVSLGIVVIFALILRFLSQRSQGKKTLSLICTAGILMTFPDRQGLYILLAIVGFLFLNYLFFRNDKQLKLFKFLTVASILSLTYSYVIAPFLIKIAIGHFPDFSYHEIDLSLTKPIFFRYSTLYSLDVFKYFFGNLPRILTLFFLLNFLIIFILGQTKITVDRLKHAFILALGILAVLILNTLMILRHNAIPLEDVKRVYYSLPLSTIILLSTLFFCGMILKLYPKTQKFLTLALCLILILNITSLGNHSRIIKNGLLKENYESSGKIIDCIKPQKTVSTFNLRDDMGKFCDFMRSQKIGF